VYKILKGISKKQLGFKIWATIKDFKTTQKVVAKAAGLSQQTLSNLVTGKAYPSYEAMLGLGYAFGVEADWFFTPYSEEEEPREG